ncbi:MAG: flagellar protein FlgN [Deltaproteobacteria bacterium]|nr:flagellar protein FlgN [Deltaproteobacteria bacterium]
MSMDESIIRELEVLLKRECELYRSYLALLKEERSWLPKFSAQKVERFTLGRADLYEKMRACQDRRLEIMRSFPQSRGSNLRKLVQELCDPVESQRILPLCEELRSLVIKTQRGAREHSQVVHFALKSVHGLLSILRSATQSVLKSYDRKGSAHQSCQPVRSRMSGVLKQA